MLGDMFSGASGMFQSGQLNGFLERFKEMMENGDENLDIPVLEPLVMENPDIEWYIRRVGLVEGFLENLRIDGLSNYTVKQADFPMEGFKAKVYLLFHEIKIETRYDITGIFLDEHVEGCGDLALRIEGLKVMADLQFEIKGGRLYVSRLGLRLKVREFDCNISELYVNNDLSEDISKTITEEAPNFLEEHQNPISQFVSEILRKFINDKLKKYTLVNLLDMIAG